MEPVGQVQKRHELFILLLLSLIERHLHLGHLHLALGYFHVG